MTTAKKEYKKAFLDVRAIVNRHDPDNLIVMSCPEDEYDPEVGDILSSLRSVSNVEETAEMIKRVFERWLGTSGGVEKYRPAAAELFRLKEKYAWLDTKSTAS